MCERRSLHRKPLLFYSNPAQQVKVGQHPAGAQDHGGQRVFGGGGAGEDYGNSTFLRPNGNFPNGALAYFTVPTWPATGIPPAPGVGRNTFRGPRYFGLDMTLQKAFGLPKIKGLGESARLNLELNAYNVFNKLNLTNINPTISTDGRTSNPQFGQARNAFAGRIVEAQARFRF